MGLSTHLSSLWRASLLPAPPNSACAATSPSSHSAGRSSTYSVI
jgi:hypothetical protein